MKKLTLALLTALATMSCSHADEADIRKAFGSRFPDTKITSIGKTPVAGLYEMVIDDNQVIYADQRGNYLIIGELVEMKTSRSLTRERMDKLLEVKFDSLPLNQAIKIVKGNGKRRLAVFSDPDCPYCQKLEPELFKIKDVTLYIFPFPLPMHKEAVRKIKQVWCSSDRAKAWEDMMLRNRLPEKGRTDCDNPVDENIALAKKLRIDGTPALIFSNGRRVPGYAERERIEALLAEAEGSGS